MKERPILFTPANALKCHDGTKTQTRRILKHQPGKFVHIEYDERKGWQYWWDVGTSGMPDVSQEYAPLKCPYGHPGDRLWVREAFALWREGFDRRGHVIYRADMKDKAGEDFSRPDLMGLSKWYPSIHMKRIYCRTVLEITEIRVQRLQEISEEDAKAEGAYPPPAGTDDDGAHFDSGTCRDGFIDLWRSINGPGSWAANPWVWCVSFKRVQP